MQVVGGCRALDSGNRAGSVLMDNHAAELLCAVGDPEHIGDRRSQLVRLGRARIVNQEILAAPAGWRRRGVVSDPGALCKDRRSQADAQRSHDEEN